MKRIHHISLGMLTSMALILPLAAFADRNEPGDNHEKMHGKGHRRDAQVTQEASVRGPNSTHQMSVSNQTKMRGASMNGSVAMSQDSPTKSRDTTTRSFQRNQQPRETASTRETSQRNGTSMNGSVAMSQDSPTRTNKTTTRSFQRNQQPREIASTRQTNQRNVTSALSVSSQSGEPSRTYQRDQRRTDITSNHREYNRSNNYGGLWVPESAHSDWSRDREHFYNHHNYRWHDGGWIIIDSGYTPSTYVRYSNGGSLSEKVQERLAEKGYYHGAIDGDIGPGTRNAIADYQSDHDLRVTGRINDSLLESLHL